MRETRYAWPLQVFILEFKKLSSYRVDFWLRMVFAGLSRVFVSYYLWDAVFREMGVKELGGYTFQAMIFYFVIAALVSNMVLVPIDQFSSEIYDGTLTRYLLYPTSFYIYKSMTALAYGILAALQVIGGGIVVLLLVGIPPELHLSIPNAFLSLLACFLSSYLYRIMQALLELIAFWADRVFGLLVALYFVINFFGGGVIPLSLFPAPVLQVLSFTPFPYLIAFPVNVFLGKVSFQEMVVGLSAMFGWAFALTVLASVVWKRGLRRYSSVGI